MYAQLSARLGRVASAPEFHMRPSEAAGLMGVVLLMAAFAAPAGLRVFLSAAGLLGVAGFRLAAARAGWARRGAGWERSL
jgi:hypothetical protein